jgi:ribulose-5-phosphate 4-epimerase/fuculose-1-phosphate aldolase
MDIGEKAMQWKPAGMPAAEWALRLELAACYRAFDWLGWSELIYNHITARVPGPERHYLINPYGLWYSEVTAANLVRVNLDGKAVDGSKHPVNLAGFVIHSAIHAAREDAHCVIHTHTTAGSAVACKREGLRYDNFYSAILHGDVAYHAFEGNVVDTGEQPRLVASLGAKRVLILRNHGLLAIGSCVADAFLRYWTLERACQIQAATDAMGGENLPVSEAVLADTPRRIAPFRAGPRPGGEVFDALLRRAGIRYEDLI